jgi:hypothetical protein
MITAMSQEQNAPLRGTPTRAKGQRSTVSSRVRVRWWWQHATRCGEVSGQRRCSQLCTASTASRPGATRCEVAATCPHRRRRRSEGCCACATVPRPPLPLRQRRRRCGEEPRDAGSSNRSRSRGADSAAVSRDLLASLYERHGITVGAATRRIQRRCGRRHGRTHETMVVLVVLVAPSEARAINQ